jgi:hypothetical protein
VAAAIASSVVTTALRSARSSRGRRAGMRLDLVMMRRIACTASRGYAPAAVSAESITASVPSRIAFATSLASARVGRGCSIIDSSICVAVITGRPRPLARGDDLLLRERHALVRQLDAQVAARDHHGVGGAEDLVDVLERLVLLDLRDDEQAPGASPAAARRRRAAHEAERHVLELLLDREAHVGLVLLGDARRRHLHAGEVHPLVALHRPAVHDARAHAPARHVDDHELDEAVVDEDAVAGADVGGERLVGDRQLARGDVERVVLGDEHDVGARVELDGRGERADADARPLQVAEDRDVASHLRRPAAAQSAMRSACCSCVPCEKLMRATLRPGLEQAGDGFTRRAGGAQRPDDLGARMISIGHDLAVVGEVSGRQAREPVS